MYADATALAAAFPAQGVIAQPLVDLEGNAQLMIIVASRHAFRLLGPAEAAYVRLVGQVLLNARATHRLLEATAAQARFVQAFSHEASRLTSR